MKILEALKMDSTTKCKETITRKRNACNVEEKYSVVLNILRRVKLSFVEKSFGNNISILDIFRKH